MHIDMNKKDKNKKAKPSTKLELFFTIVPVLLVVLFLWRSIPDGVYRLDLGQSQVGEKAIALTFDDGPSGHTERLLDGLAQYGAKASFFVIGTQAEKKPDVVKRAYDEGHLIGNHTYDHPNFYITPDSTSIESIEKGGAVIESIIGEKPLFLRAPYGNVWPHQFKHFDRIFIHWTFHTFDWNKEDSQEIYDDIMSKASDGSIILLHDTRPATVDAVLKAIPELQAEGYEFVRVDDLLTRNGDALKMGVPYRKCEFEKGALIF